ncbi:MAG TPA: peptidoglycan DD-metalloendopeptidase family protein [Candidatus Saccharimonadales bacterium]|jgi:murein DD-endopeptidase MepM/ murein hydrolase activator NlpD
MFTKATQRWRAVSASLAALVAVTVIASSAEGPSADAEETTTQAATAATTAPTDSSIQEFLFANHPQAAAQYFSTTSKSPERKQPAKQVKKSTPATQTKPKADRTDKVQKPKARKTYKIQDGDVLSEISPKVNVRMRKLQACNPEKIPDFDTIKAGDVLRLSCKAAPQERASAPSPKKQRKLDKPTADRKADVRKTDVSKTRLEHDSKKSDDARKASDDDRKKATYKTITVRKGGSWVYPIKPGKFRHPRHNGDYGERDIDSSPWHNGYDFAAPIGTPIRAAHGGKVVMAGDKGAWGKMVAIRGGGLTVIYAHQKRFAKGIHVGADVDTGQTIGYIGMTGRTFGPHLHVTFCTDLDWCIKGSGAKGRGSIDPHEFLKKNTGRLVKKTIKVEYDDAKSRNDRKAGQKKDRTSAKQEAKKTHKVKRSAHKAPKRASSRSNKRYDSSDHPKTIARRMMLDKYGWGEKQFNCYNNIIMRESVWNVHADNPTSSAYGIPQALPGRKMASAGSDWRTNPVTQIKWGLGYVKDRYGTPCQAWQFKQSHDWY